ncbi:glycosyltransferase [Candidatus Uhrbacteria bacterium]|nr:glycosyltransferase [Candidatus Uhrbacteria bacterium]
MQVSIVIPAKNEQAHLPDLFASLKQQSFRDYEVIVADAHSTDRTRQIATEFGARIVDGGLPGIGRNRGVEVAQAERIIFFDADILLPHPNFLADCLAECERRTLDVATCRVKPHEGNTLDHLMHGAYNAYTIATEKFLPHVAGFCFFTTRTVHQAIGGFNEDILLAEDHDYARRAKKAGFHTGILRCHTVPVSIRRLEKEGRFKLAAKYAMAEVLMLTRGPLKRESMPFDYEFAKFSGDPKERG